MPALSFVHKAILLQLRDMHFMYCIASASRLIFRLQG
jgi:hypothetical protein